MKGQDCQRLTLNATVVSFHFMHSCCAIAVPPHSLFLSVIILCFSFPPPLFPGFGWILFCWGPAYTCSLRATLYLAYALRA